VENRASKWVGFTGSCSQNPKLTKTPNVGNAPEQENQARKTRQGPMNGAPAPPLPLVTPFSRVESSGGSLDHSEGIQYTLGYTIYHLQPGSECLAWDGLLLDGLSVEYGKMLRGLWQKD
jgi:hypothetical protein